MARQSDVEEAVARQAGELAEVRAVMDLLVELLVARGDLAAGDAKVIGKVRERARRAAVERPKVRLGVLQDKYVVPNSGVDCPSLLHLCRARCCTYSVALTTQDLDEGHVRWELDQPYFLRHGRDGYCHHLGRSDGRCDTYEHRPATCREFDCRDDKRVWLDFEAKIPAPMPEEIGALPLVEKG